MKNRKLVVGILLGVVLLLAVGGFSIWQFVINNETGNNPSDQLQIEATVIKDHVIPAADEIISKAKSPDEAAVQLTSYGYLKSEVAKYDEAYDLFEKVVGLSGITEDNKQLGLVGMYKMAEKMGDSAKQQSAKDAMSEAVFQKYLAPASKEGEQGE